MRKINGKLFLALLLGVFTLGGGVFAVHYFQYGRVADAVLYQARRMEEKGQIPVAARYYQRYLEFNPRDLEVMTTLAKLWAGDAFAPGSRQRAGAVDLLDRVLTYKDDPELRRLLIKTALQIHDVKKARDHLERMLPRRDMDVRIAHDKALREKKVPLPKELVGEDKDTGQLEAFWGQVLEDDKKTAEAIHAYRLAVRHAPEELLGYLRLAYLLRRENITDSSKRKDNFLEADRVIDALVKVNANSHESYLTRWRYRRDFDLMAVRDNAVDKIDLESAAEDVADAIKRKPESVEVLLAAADLERLRGRVAGDDTAKTIVQRRSQMKEHRHRASDYLKRGLEIVARNRNATTEYGKFQLLWHKGNLLLDELDIERAQREEDNQPPSDDPKLKEEIASVIEEVRKSPVPAAADYMRGRLLVHEKQWAKGARLFEQARALLDGQPELACQADLYLGRCYENLEEHSRMVAAYDRVLTRDASSVQAQVGLAQAYAQQGQIDKALQVYAVLMKGKRVPPRGWLDIARLEMQRQLQNEDRNFDLIERALKQAEKLNPKATLDIALMRAEILFRKNDAGEARKLIELERLRDPKNPEVYAALVDLALRETKPKPALARTALAQGKREAGDRAALRLAEARLLAVTEGKVATAKIVSLAENRKHFSPEDESRLLGGLAEVLSRNEAIPEARKLWQSQAVLPAQKNNLRLRLMLFDLAMREVDEPGMQTVLDDIREVEQDSGVYHRYGEALMLIWKARRATGADEREKRDEYMKQARTKLDQAQSQRPSWAPLFVARSEIAELKGNPEQALKELETAMRNGDTSVSTIRRRVVLLTSLGKEQEAQRLLDQLKRLVRGNSELIKLTAYIKTRLQNFDEANAVLNDLRSRADNDSRAILLQAQINAQAGKHPEAEKLFDEAIAVLESDPVPYVAKVQYLVERRKKDGAQTTIEALKKNVPAEKAALALGRCHDLVGEPKDAVKLYTSALSANRGDSATVQAVASAHLAAGRAALAEPLLQEISDGKVKASSAEVALARRSLALVLANGTDFGRFRKALDLVGVALDETGRLPAQITAPREEPTETQRVRARVLSTQNQKQFRTAAIKLFENLDKRQALNPDDRFILSILYEQEGESRKSQENLRELVAARQTQNPRYLAQYAMMLIAQKRELNEAEKYVKMLEELEEKSDLGANTYASVELRARLLEANGKNDDALKLLRDHVGREGARPEEGLIVLSALIRQKRYPEAFAMCEATWKEGKVAPEAVGAVSVGLLRVWTDAKDAQVRAVETYLKSAHKAKPESVVLMMHLADLYDKRGQYDLAIEQYKGILDAQPNNIVALNNLAWMLAMRSGDAKAALAHIDRAIEGMGRRSDLLDTRAMVYLALREPSKAIEDLREALQDSPTPARRYHLARAYHENREETKAREELARLKNRAWKPDSLHPVEVEGAQRLLAEYGLKN